MRSNNGSNCIYRMATYHRGVSDTALPLQNQVIYAKLYKILLFLYHEVIDSFVCAVVSTFYQHVELGLGRSIFLISNGENTTP